jgi:hypothetical protein
MYKAMKRKKIKNTTRGKRKGGGYELTPKLMFPLQRLD